MGFRSSEEVKWAAISGRLNMSSEEDKEVSALG